MRLYRPIAALLLLSGFLLFSSGCGEKKSDRPNVLFISLDTLRADHLHCYGYPVETSPVLDRLAGKGARFETVIAQSPWTLPSHLSLFTGLYPSTLLKRAGRFALPPGTDSLASCFKKAGYRTGGFTGGGNISAGFGFHQGFDIYDEKGGGIGLIRQKAAGWAKTCRSDNFFLLVHCYDIHHPYVTGTKYDHLLTGDYSGTMIPDKPTLVRINRGDIALTEADKQFIISRYDAGILYTDEQIGLFLDDLASLDTGRDLLVLITSDHGEELGERDMMGWHGHTLYRELMEIPLILYYPPRIPAGRVIETRVRGIDLMPTLLDYTGIEPPAGIAGTSLRPLIEGRVEADRTAYCEKYVNKNFDIRNELDDRKFSTDQFSLTRDQWKLIRFVDKGDELFNLAEDRGETLNLIDDEKAVADRLGEALDAMMAENSAGRDAIPEPDVSRLSEQTRKQLKELGYID